MKLAAASALVVLGCSSLFGDLDRVIALEIVGGTSYTLEIGDSLRLTARAITAGGDTVPGAVIEWAVLDTGTVGFTLDAATGLVVGTAPGKGRVQARYENLRSDPILITVTATTSAALRRGKGKGERGKVRAPSLSPFPFPLSRIM